MINARVLICINKIMVMLYVISPEKHQMSTFSGKL